MPTVLGYFYKPDEASRCGRLGLVTLLFFFFIVRSPLALQLLRERFCQPIEIIAYWVEISFGWKPTEMHGVCDDGFIFNNIMTMHQDQ